MNVLLVYSHAKLSSMGARTICTYYSIFCFINFRTWSAVNSLHLDFTAHHCNLTLLETDDVLVVDTLVWRRHTGVIVFICRNGKLDSDSQEPSTREFVCLWTRCLLFLRFHAFMSILHGIISFEFRINGTDFMHSFNVYIRLKSWPCACDYLKYQQFIFSIKI